MSFVLFGVTWAIFAWFTWVALLREVSTENGISTEDYVISTICSLCLPIGALLALTWGAYRWQCKLKCRRNKKGPSNFTQWICKTKGCCKNDRD